MSLIKVGATVAGSLITSKLGGNDSKSTTEVNFPPWLENYMTQTAGNMANSPVPQINPDNLTAALNPWIMDSLGQAANYAQGAGQDQVNAMNMMGANQAAVGNSLEGLAGLQGLYGANALDGAGSWLMQELAAGGGSGPNGSPYGGNYNVDFDPDAIKFQYDQDTFDQSYNNLIGSAQGAFDSYSNKTRTNNLFQNLPGLKIGSQLLGGANTKVGQGASLLDAMTNQQIMDYGAQMQQWASGTADANAMSAGVGNLESATSRSNAALAAATQRANAALTADTSRYNALVGAATNMYGYGAGMLGDASSSLSNAGSMYDMAGNTFGNANVQATNNMNTSLAAGNYLQQYDQQALDRWNDALLYNASQPFNQNLAMYNAFNGTATGSTTRDRPSFLNTLGTLGSTVETLFPGTYNSDIRLKKNVRPLTVQNGVWFYTWDWNEIASHLGADDQPTTGVIAQQVQKTHPDAVTTDRHGYYMVDYSKLH